MSVSKRRIKIGNTECGYDMSETSLLTHIVGFFTLAFVLLFSYAALLEDGPLTAMTGFIFGFGFLLLIYGHHFDRFYIHIGNKVKIGGDAYNPSEVEEQNKVTIEREE